MTHHVKLSDVYAVQYWRNLASILRMQETLVYDAKLSWKMRDQVRRLLIRADKLEATFKHPPAIVPGHEPDCHECHLAALTKQDKP